MPEHKNKISTYAAYFDGSLKGSPYFSNEELLADILAYADMYMETAVAIKELMGEGTAFHLRGIVITSDEVKAAIESGKVKNRELELGPDIKKEFRDAWAHITGRAANSGEMRLFAVKRRFRLNAFEFFALILGICVECDRKYERLFGYLQDNVNVGYPTLGLAKALYSMTDIVPESSVFRCAEEGRPARKLLFSQREVKTAKDFFLAERIKIPGKIVSYVNGHDSIGGEIFFCGSYADAGARLAPVYINSREIDGLKAVIKTIISENTPTFIHLYGPKGTGKMFAVRHLAGESGRNLVVFDVEDAMESGRPMQEMLDKLIVEALCEERIICLKNVPVVTDENRTYIKNMISYLRRYQNLLIATSYEKEVYDFSLDFRMLQVRYEMPDFGERMLLWREFLKEKRIEPDFDVEDLANKYILTPKQIKDVISAAQISAVYSGNEKVSEADFVGAVRAQSINRLKERATAVKTAYTWDDLVAEPEQKNMMVYAVNHIKYKNKVNGEWGFDKKLPYGKGLSVLFYGPPGTGKTMAAQVIANELGLELYKVDLSQMVSKYIGETEKNLSELFNEAQYSNAILFFDEADALFSKRTEVSDSKDKYSNVETSYLLQKIEEYEGIAILASNYLVNFDDAFKRRIKFIINFQMPGPEMRYKLWRKMFPKEAPTDGSVDFEFLADTFEFTGSNIKNIVVSAAYMAAAEGTDISMRHVVGAIRIENAKFGKVLLKHEFGRYAEFY